MKYSEAKIGETYLLVNDGDKVKIEKILVAKESFPTKYSDVLVKLTFSDGSVHYGWANKELI